MTIITRPYDGAGIAGDDGPYSSQNWRDTWFQLFSNDNDTDTDGDSRGVLKGVYSDLLVSATSPASSSIQVASGAALIQGMWFYNDAIATIVVPANATGNPRFDYVVAQYNATAGVNVGTLAIVTGSTSLPVLTQVKGGIYQIPLAIIVAPDAFVNITSADIFDARSYANIPDALMIDVQNKSGVELYGGDLVVWDNANDRGVTTSTSTLARVAGVCKSYMPVNGWGRVQVAGVTQVNVDSAVSRGDYLRHSTTAKQGESAADGFGFGVALSAGSATAPPLVALKLDNQSKLTAQGDLLTNDGVQDVILGAGNSGDLLYMNGSDVAWGFRGSVLPYVGVQVYKTANQIVGASATAAITFDAEFFDSNAFHDNVTNNTRLTVPAGFAGKYFVYADYISSNGGQVYIRLNNTTNYFGASPSTVTYFHFGLVLDLSVGDYVESYVIAGGGGTTVTGTASFTRFGMYFLGA